MYRAAFTRDGGKPFFLVGTEGELTRFKAIPGVQVSPDPYNPEFI